jgi:transposase
LAAGAGERAGYGEQSRQLTEARKDFAWLATGSQTVQQQALRDFAQAMTNFFAETHRRPTWRKAGVHEGFRIVGRRGAHWDIRRLSRKVGQVRIPKVGWVRFRWSRDISAEAKSFRVNRDRAGRRHVCFAVIPPAIDGPATGAVVGVDRGVAVSAALSSHACGHCAADNRESQAVFRCRACGHTDHADVNAAKNIAAGHAVTARGALQPLGGAVNREPQPVLSSV